MGHLTVQSYCGAQTFEALGLSSELVADYFSGTRMQIEGVGLDVIAAETEARHRLAYPEDGVTEPPGPRDRRRVRLAPEGPRHLFDPHTVFRLQHATRTGATTSSVLHAAGGQPGPEIASARADEVASTRERWISTRSSPSARSSSASPPVP
ncbi:hypothetical protein QJS66_02200 [Kocuria rhizophila]|nr:hypothetical protein QJS66_02200 [Kocuria rhizophila]